MNKSVHSVKLCLESRQLDRRDEIRWLKYLRNLLKRHTQLPLQILKIVKQYVGVNRPFTEKNQNNKPISKEIQFVEHHGFVRKTFPCPKCGEHKNVVYSDPFNWCNSSTLSFRVMQGLVYCLDCKKCVGDVPNMRRIYHCSCECRESEKLKIPTIKVRYRRQDGIKFRKYYHDCHGKTAYRYHSPKHRFKYLKRMHEKYEIKKMCNKIDQS